MKFIKKLVVGLAFLIALLLVLINIPENRKEIDSRHFRIIFCSAIDESAVKALSVTLEENYSRIGNDLQTIPADKIETYIYSSRWWYIKATNNWGGSGNIEGIGKLHFMNQAWGESDNQKVAIHEFAHTVLLKLLIDQEPMPLNSKAFDNKFSGFPLWLWEAVSVYEANQFVDPKTLAYLNNGKYPSIKELNNPLKGGKIYSCGFTIIEYILSRYGWDKLIELIKNYGHLQKVLNVSENQFLMDWYGFVKEKYL